jgi:hypothetical protein
MMLSRNFIQSTLFVLLILSNAGTAQAKDVPGTGNKTAAAGQQDSAPPVRPGAEQREVSQQSFKRMAEVLRDPRCMNCHTVTQFPRQGDDRHRHQQMVMRGVANMGAPTMQCSNCHQTKNSPDGRVPGAPGWHLAPLSMAWEDLKTDKALCQAVLDRKKNGDRDIEKLVEHMTADALVQWAWTPGERKPPGINQQDFHELVKLWAHTGAACPRN